MILEVSLVLLGYLAGSVSSAILVCRAMGLPDPRSQGSHNPGATNVLRFGGKGAAAVTLSGDVLKGLLPVLVALALGVGDRTLAAVGLAAFLGHLYPVFFGFAGGKGVATAIGALLGWSWPVAIAGIATWLLVATVSRISSLAAITSAALAPLYLWWLSGRLPLVAAGTVMSILLVWRHRSNIRSILAGTEDTIGAERK